MQMKTILVTGSAGFIGANLVKRLLGDMTEGTIVGLDNLNDYYDPSLKEYRLRELEKARPAGINYQFSRATSPTGSSSTACSGSISPRLW